MRVGNNRPDLGMNPVCNKFTGFIEEGRPLFLPCGKPMPGAFVSVHLETPGAALSICETFVYTDHGKCQIGNQRGEKSDRERKRKKEREIERVGEAAHQRANPRHSNELQQLQVWQRNERKEAKWKRARRRERERRERK